MMYLASTVYTLRISVLEGLRQEEREFKTEGRQREKEEGKLKRVKELG